jgi:hypothetical protein
MAPLGIRESAPFPYDADSPLDGIIAWLTERYKGNVAEKHIVTITQRSEASKGGHVFHGKNAADLGNINCFCSGDGKKQWLCYDLGDLLVKPTHYTIKSPVGSANSKLMRSWVVEGAGPDSQWVTLDEQINNGAMAGPNMHVTFPIHHTRDSKQIIARES